MFPTLDSSRIRLREMTTNDVDNLFEYYSNPEMMKYTSTDAHSSKEETLARVIKLSSSYENRKGIAWIIEEKINDIIIGDIGLFYITPDAKKAGIGFNISQKNWNQGYGTEALTLVLRYAISQLQINRIEATCKIANLASERVMTKAGMHYEGTLRQYSCKNGLYYDIKMFSMIHDDLCN